MLARANETVDEETLQKILAAGLTTFEVLLSDSGSSDSIRKTLLLDKVESKEEALIEIYRRMRPGNPATQEVAQDFVDQLFFKASHYDLSGVGRLKINLRLGVDTSIDLRTLRKEDILLTARTLVELRDTQGQVDDIDHLGNRRVRAVGELLENQYRIGLVRMERAIKERMSLQEVDALMPHDLINPKPVSAVVKEFFGTSQHGLPELKIADLLEDTELLRQARCDAFDLARQDPELCRPEHAVIRRDLLETFGADIKLVDVG